MSVRLSAWKNSSPTGTIFIKFDIFRLYVQKFKFLLKSEKNYRYCTWRASYTEINISLSSSWNKKCFRQKLKIKSKHTCYVQQLFFFRKSCSLWDNVEKYYRARQVTDDNIAHARYTHKICNSYCFSTAPMVARTRFNVTFYVHCLRFLSVLLPILLFRHIGKAVPLQAWSGPEGSRNLGFPDFMITAQDGGKVVSLTHRPPLPPGDVPGTHFC